MNGQGIPCIYSTYESGQQGAFLPRAHEEGEVLASRVLEEAESINL